MPSMKFSNILLETNPRSVAYPGLYCKADQPVVVDPQSGEWTMLAAGLYDFTTYFNSLSVMKLKQYTIAKSFSLHLELKGAASTIQQTKCDVFAAYPEAVEGTEKHIEASEEWVSIDLPLVVDDDAILVAFNISTEGQVFIRNSYYEVAYDGDLREVNLLLSTTTFKKESYIINNINLIKKNIIESEEEISKHFDYLVVDNGRTLDAEALSGAHTTVVPNDNVGGAGGFTRGMITALESEKTTHVLLMDDDVAVSPESIKRTYNLLKIVNDEYSEAMISGAMLNFEVGEDQWEDIGYMTERGTFSACKPPLHLTRTQDLVYNEAFTPTRTMREQMYAAWWYCCIPVSVIQKNGLPLPVFVRCDDAEYGIRCKTKFITMNSLCVWHLSFFERYNPAVERYQTTRNTMIAQATCGMAPKSDFMRELHNNIRLELKKFSYENAELCLDAFEDFMKGPGFFSQIGKSEETFMAANKKKEKLVSLEELQAQADADPDLHGFNINEVDRQLIDGDKPRSFAERIHDFITDNGQRVLKSEGKGYAVIPLQGWIYPAGVIRGKNKLIVVDWYNRKGCIRTKDVKRYNEIQKRYKRDLRYFKANGDRIKAEYAQARSKLTSMEYWKNYLKMD
ncbi:glycosyltransferase [Alloscardovia criceti]|uniref:glycosyltransferase n=1 Tax=Alloscardovia criceti TaxID=356828 RepID=UPI0003617D4B|nr:glycosyltransferase [Alloscardovia criceti]